MAGGFKQVLPRRVYTVPRSLGRRRVTMVARLGGGVCLAATWDFLGIFPSRTSGVAVRWDEEGRAGGGGCLCRFALAASGGGTGVQERPPSSRSNVVRPRWTNRQSARCHGNCSIKQGRPAGAAAKSRALALRPRKWLLLALTENLEIRC